MRRLGLVLLVMAAALLSASGMALAVDKVGTNGSDTLMGTNGNDNLLGGDGQDNIFSLDGEDNLVGGAGNDNVIGGNERPPEGATRTWWAVRVTTFSSPAEAPTGP